MRNLAILLAATSLSACGGGGAQSVSGTAVAQTGAATTITGATTISASSAIDYSQFLTPTLAQTYSGVGTSQVYSYSTYRFPGYNYANPTQQDKQVYASNASTVRDSKITITYDPRDAIFTLKVTDPRSGALAQTRYQDPVNRTAFGGAQQPNWGNENFAAFTGIAQNSNIRFLQAGDGDPISPAFSSGTGVLTSAGTNTTPPDGLTGAAYQATTFFYETPGTTGNMTRYVSLAGYVRNDLKWSDITANGVTYQETQWKLERGAFAYGLLTDNNAVPRTGTGTYTGSMIATMIVNPTLDAAAANQLPSYYQWISGTATTTVNFATNAVTLGLNGIVGAPKIDRYSSPTTSVIAAGATFTAAGTATINLSTTGGFTGQFQSAGFSAASGGYSPSVSVAGSSIDGAFYGPAAEEVGGGFRIVGGVPDQRVDIGGAFKGKKP